MVFQHGFDPIAIGPHLHADLDQHCIVVVRVDFVSDYNFRVVVDMRLPGLWGTPWARDKGKLVQFQANVDTRPPYAMPNLRTAIQKLRAVPQRELGNRRSTRGR